MTGSKGNTIKVGLGFYDVITTTDTGVVCDSFLENVFPGFDLSRTTPADVNLNLNVKFNLISYNLNVNVNVKL